MHFLDENLRNFWLHESNISRICIEEGRIVINFDKGFFDKNHVQKNNCMLLIDVNNFNEKNAERYVNITRISRLTKKEITLKAFNRLLKKHNFVIDLEYYSEFERSMLLVGYVNGTTFNFKITDINDILFSCLG